MVVDFRLGDVLQLKKVHPCGSDRWEVVRIGADIGLRCTGCQRRVLIERRVLERRVKACLAIGSKVDTTSSLA
ncbi:MAG: DUF951 domain-containing protein [Chloroflexi bacterium]|nr:DUF951 domain-containing protein [Chloroflexota bacterium]